MEMQSRPWHGSLVGLVSIIALNILAFGPTLLQGQNSATPSTPEEALRSYRKMDAEGERLTLAGWYKASNYFLKPERPPQSYTVAVTDGERVEGVRVKGPKAEGYVLCSGVGQIDSLGRFTAVVGPSLLDPLGRPAKAEAPFMYGPSAPLERVYNLVLTENHWEFGPHGEALREVKGLPEWRIEKFEFEPWITIEVAIRYLAKLRDESNDNLIRRNAEKSIATLRSFQ